MSSNNDSDDSSVEISDVELSDNEDNNDVDVDESEANYVPGDGYENEDRGNEEKSDDGSEEEYDDDDQAEDCALLQIKEDKFFERLNHFLDVQKKIEERMQRIDSKNRLKAINVETHSKGILEADGTFKVEYQQQDSEGESVAQNLGEVYESAYQIKQSLRDLLDAMVDKVKGLDYVDAYIADLKPRNIANDKAREEYLTRQPGPPEAWIYDILRASVACKTMKQMESVNKFLMKKAHIVQAKNRFVRPAFSGYRDLLYHVKLDWAYKANVHFVAEIQVHHKDVQNLESMYGLLNHYNYFRPIFAGPSRSVIDTTSDLETIRQAGKIDKALIDSILRSDDPDQLNVYAKLFHLKLENFDVALTVYSRVLSLQEELIGQTHPKTAATYQTLGLVLAKVGNFDQALRSLQTCLEIQEQVFGPDSPEIAITRSYLGHTIIERGDDSDELLEHRGALQQYRKALVVREKACGEDHLDVAASYQNIGKSLCVLGDFQGALAAYRESLSILESLLGENHEDVAKAHTYLGGVLRDTADYQGAMEEFSIALAIQEEVFGKSHVLTAESHTRIGKLLTDVQDYDEAENRHKKALRIRDTIMGKESLEAAESHYWIGYVLNQKGDYSTALEEHNIAYMIRKKILPKRHPDVRSSLRSVSANEYNQEEP